MLLTHTSGIGEYDVEFMTSLVCEPLRERTARDRLGVIRRYPPIKSDAGKFRYSDLNYVVLAMVLDGRVTDGAYCAIDSAFLQPLGLAHTWPSVTPRIDGLVEGYEDANSLFGTATTMRDGALIRNPQFECGGGGFVSTPRDLARWMAALRQGTAFPDTLWPAAVAKPAGVADTAHHRRGMGMAFPTLVWAVVGRSQALVRTSGWAIVTSMKPACNTARSTPRRRHVRGHVLSGRRERATGGVLQHRAQLLTPYAGEPLQKVVHRRVVHRAGGPVDHT